VQIENGSDKNAVILSEIAVAFGDFHQVREGLDPLLRKLNLAPPVQ
jgi:hypothetical protein